jgi:hypothetical protein
MAKWNYITVVTSKLWKWSEYKKYIFFILLKTIYKSVVYFMIIRKSVNRIQ